MSTRKNLIKRHMRRTTYLTVKNNITKRQEQGFHDWDDDLETINDLVKEYGTGMEDLIMSIYRKVVKTWDKVDE